MKVPSSRRPSEVVFTVHPVKMRLSENVSGFFICPTTTSGVGGDVSVTLLQFEPQRSRPAASITSSL